tara:strand:- start:35 stop:304 length:270 start_codon:yes stop_codon:yes gene_type:complete
MHLTTHLQLQCAELQELDPDGEMAFFTRELFAKMQREFEQIPKLVELRCYSHLLAIRFAGKSFTESLGNLHNVKDSLNALKTPFAVTFD